MGEGGAAARRAGLHAEREVPEARTLGLGDATRTHATGLRRASAATAAAAAAAAAAAGVAAASLVAVAVLPGMRLRTAVCEWVEAGRAAADTPDEGRAVLLLLVDCLILVAAETGAAAVPVRCPPLLADVAAAAVVVFFFFFATPRGAA
jgi:hypothetical protein